MDNFYQPSHETYVTRDIAKLLTTVGFNWEVQPPDLSLPTLDVAARWLREVKGIALNITAHDGGRYDWRPVYLPHSAPEVYFPLHTVPLFDTYEDALRDALYITLRNITQLNPNQQ